MKQVSVGQVLVGGVTQIEVGGQVVEFPLVSGFISLNSSGTTDNVERQVLTIVFYVIQALGVKLQ